jgi:hypothetical protein
MYLVASMTVATALLLWMEHLVVPEGTYVDSVQAVGPVATALETEEPIEPGDWDEIVISYRDRVPGDPAVALAVPGRPYPYHFVIQPTGEIHTLPKWQGHTSDGGVVEPRAINICLSGRPGLNGISAEQWDALVSMLRQLRARCQLPAKAVRLDPQSDPQYRADVSPQAVRLRQMLLAADIID